MTTTNSSMKTAGQWALATVMYILLYAGAEEGIWPLVSHFHHHDSQMPNILERVVGAFLLPLVIAFLFAATSRLRLSPWPFLFAPFLLIVLNKYLADAFYPPFWTEFSSLLMAGGIQGASAWTGWFLYQRCALRKQVKQSVSGEGAHGIVVTHY
jgi:hypothetical protein